MNIPHVHGRIFLLLLACIILVGCSRESKVKRHVSRAENYLANKKFAAAELECLQVLRLQKNDRQALGLLQQVYFEQGRILKMLPVLEMIEKIDATNVPIRLMLARSYMVFQDASLAREQARAVLRLDPANLDATLILAETAASEDEKNEVTTLIRAWPQTNSPGLHIVRAVLSLRERNVAGAEAELQKALQLNSKSLEAHQLLAGLFWARGDFKRADQLFEQASGLSPNEPLERMRWAVLKIRFGDLEGARKILDSILSRQPEFLPAQTHLAIIAFEQKRLDDCEKIVQKALLQDGSLYVPLELRARLKLAKGATDEGVKELERLTKTFRFAPNAYVFLARGYLQQQRVSEAYESLEKALTFDPNLAEAVVLLAELDIRKGNFQKASDALEPLLQARPGMTRVRTVLAEAYRGLGAFEKAAQEYRQLVNALPNNPQVKTLLGMTYREQKKDAEARTLFESACKGATDYFPAANQLMDLDLEAKDFVTASNRAALLISRFPAAAEPHYMMARLQIATKNTSQAEAALLKVIELQPEFASAYDALANLYSMTGRQGEALSKLDELLAKNPKNGRAIMQRGLLLEQAKQFQPALSAYEQVIALNPDFVPALNNAAYLIAEHDAGDLDKALQMARRAAQLSSDNASVQDTLGWVLFKRGDVSEAARILKQSAAKQVANPESQFHYGMACYSSGDAEAARTAFDRALNPSRDFRGKPEAQWRAETLAWFAQQTDAQTALKLEEAQREHPKEPGVLSLLGEAHERLSNVEKARRHYEQALALNANSAGVIQKLAGLLARMPGEEESALKLIKRAQPLARGDSHLTHRLGRSAMAAGDYGLATSLFQEAVDATKDPEISFDLALCRFYMGDVTGAEAVMRRISATQAGTLATKAQYLVQVLDFYTRSDVSSAVPTITAMLKTQPDWAPALLILSRAQQQSGETNQSRQTLEAITKQRPLLVPAAIDLARLLMQSQEIEKASQLLDHAQKAAPLDSAGTGLHGQALYLAGNYSNALKVLRQATRATLVDPEVLYYLGLAYDKLGEKQQGKRTLNDALRLYPDHRLAADAREVLDRYVLESKVATKPF